MYVNGAELSREKQIRKGAGKFQEEKLQRTKKVSVVATGNHQA